MAGKSHGRVGVFKIDDPSGALQDVSAFLRNVDPKRSADKPNTTTFGQRAQRREVLGLKDCEGISVEGFLQQTPAAKLHGRLVRVLFGGFDLTAFLDSVSVKRSITLGPTETFGNVAKRREVPGLLDGSVSLGSFLDLTAGAPDPVLRAQLALAAGASGLLATSPNGFAIGNYVDMLRAAVTSHGSPFSVEEANKLSGEISADDAIYLGVSLHDLVAETSAANYTGVDEAAQTSTGGVADAQCTDFVSGSLGLKLQDSADGSVWADLAGGAFAAITAAGSQRIEISGVVRRHVRLVSTGTFSATFQVSWSRRDRLDATPGTYGHWYRLLQHANTQTVEWGPEGSTSGKLKSTGEFRIASLDVNYSVSEVETFQASVAADGDVTDSTY